LPTVSAELGPLPIGFAALRTRRFEACPALVAKNRGERILGVALLTNHNGNQSQIGCIVPISSEIAYRCTEGIRQTGVYYWAALKASKRICYIFRWPNCIAETTKKHCSKLQGISSGDVEQLDEHPRWKKKYQHSVGNKIICAQTPGHLICMA
jgi:hypothetical protein